MNKGEDSDGTAASSSGVSPTRVSLENRLRLLVENTATRMTLNEEKISTYIHTMYEKTGGIRDGFLESKWRALAASPIASAAATAAAAAAAAASASASGDGVGGADGGADMGGSTMKRATDLPAKMRLYGVSITPMPGVGGGDSTPAGPRDNSNGHSGRGGGVLTLDEHDADLVLQLIEGLEARSASLGGLLQHREEEFRAIQTKFDELRALQAALDAITEEEEAAAQRRAAEDGPAAAAAAGDVDVAVGGPADADSAPPQPSTSASAAAVPTRPTSVAVNAVATVTAKLHQRESELETLNELLLEVTREYEVERSARVALEKTHASLVKAVEGEREAYRASMLRGKVETLTRQLKVRGPHSPCFSTFFADN